MWWDDSAQHLLVVLKAAGCDLFIVDDQLFVSPPMRHIEWPDDPATAIDAHYWELRELVAAERVTVH